MAAVTIVNQTFNVNGSVRDQYYLITGASGDYLDVALGQILMVNVIPTTSGVSNVAVAAGANPSSSRLTFTAGAPFTALRVEVLGT